MICIGYRDENSIKVGFPFEEDKTFAVAVVERLKRFELNKTKSTTKKLRPFRHRYKIRNGRVVLCAYNKGVTVGTIKNIIRNTLESAENGTTITNNILSDTIRPYVSQATQAPPAELAAMRKATKQKTEAVQTQINQVKDIMIDNMDNLLSRGERVDDLEVQTESLLLSSSLFHNNTVKLERKKCCELCRVRFVMYSIIILVGLLVLGGIIFAILKVVIPFIQVHT